MSAQAGRLRSHSDHISLCAADAMVSGVLPSLNLDQDAWLGSPAMQPGQMHMGKDATFYSQHQQQQQLKRQSQPPLAPQARTSHDFVKTASAGSSHSHEHASVDSEEVRSSLLARCIARIIVAILHLCAVHTSGCMLCACVLQIVIASVKKYLYGCFLCRQRTQKARAGGAAARWRRRRAR